MLYAVLAPSTGYIKLGYSEDMATFKGRLASLQCGNGDKLVVLKTLEGARADERALHERFAAWRLTGEWFKSNHELFKFLDVTPESPAFELLDSAVFDAYERGYRAHREDFETALKAAVKKRVEVLEDRLKEAYKRNQMQGRLKARLLRDHHMREMRLVDELGWTKDQYEMWMMRLVARKVDDYLARSTATHERANDGHSS